MTVNDIMLLALLLAVIIGQWWLLIKFVQAVFNGIHRWYEKTNVGKITLDSCRNANRAAITFISGWVMLSYVTMYIQVMTM